MSENVICPNCDSGWSIEEIDLQECDYCGYPDCDYDEIDWDDDFLSDY